MTWNGLVWMWNIWSSCSWVLRIVHSSTAPSRTCWSMREGSKILPSTVKVYSCQWPATSFSGEVAPRTTVRRACDLAVADRLERRLGWCGRELHRQRLAGDNHARQRSGRRRMTLIERDGVQFVGARTARLYQHIGALSRRDQQLLHLLQSAQLDAVVGDDVQPMLVERQQHVVLVLRADQAPALHLPRPHVDGRPPLTVDRQEARRGFRKERAEVLDHVEGVEHDLRQQHDTLARPGDLRHVGEVAFDDDGAGHSACHLHIGRAV